MDDPTGQLQWPAVANQTPQVFEGVLSKGFGASVIWLRLRIDPTNAQASPKPSSTLILRIRPLYLDDVMVYDPLAGGLVGVTGDRHHPRSQDLEGLDFKLQIARGDVPRDLWLRLSSTSTRQIAVQALHPEDLVKQTQTKQIMFSFYISIILIFMFWGLVHWLFNRENLIGAFGIKQAAAFVFAVCSLGYVRSVWPADWPAEWLDKLTTISGILAVSTAIFFHLLLIGEFNPPLWVRRLMLGMLWLLPVKLLLVASDYAMQAAMLNMIEVLLAPIVFLVAVIFSRAWHEPSPAQQPLLSRLVVMAFYVWRIQVRTATKMNPVMGG